LVNYPSTTLRSHMDTVPTFLSLEIDRGEWSVPRTGRFTTGKEPPLRDHWRRVSMGPSIGLNAIHILLPLPGIKSRLSHS
jgi:hypothetical protein